MSESQVDIEDYLYDPEDERDAQKDTNVKDAFFRVANVFAMITYIVSFIIGIYVMSRTYSDNYDALYLYVASLMVFWVAPMVIAVIYFFSENAGVIMMALLVCFVVSILGLSSYQISISSDGVTLGLSSTVTAMTGLLLALWVIIWIINWVSFRKNRYVYNVDTQSFKSDELITDSFYSFDEMK